MIPTKYLIYDFIFFVRTNFHRSKYIQNVQAKMILTFEKILKHLNVLVIHFDFLAFSVVF